MEKRNENEEISCYILDDELHALDRLEILLDKINNLDVVGRQTDPEEAIDAIVKIQPEVIFLDIVMDRKTGFEVIEEIRNNGYNPCFIFVTAHNNYSINAIKTAAFDYLLKPVDINELKDTIRRYESARLLKSYQSNNKKVSFACLSPREKEILQYIVEGKTSQEISEVLYLSKNTVDTHRRNILEKTGLKSTNELIRAYFSIYS